MQRFARLVSALEPPASRDEAVARLCAYLRANLPERADDAAWAVQLLSGALPRRVLAPAMLRSLGASVAGLDDWLFAACVEAAGDAAEALALAMPTATAGTPVQPLAHWLTRTLPQWQGDSADIGSMRQDLLTLEPTARWLALRLATGSWRSPMPLPWLQQALARHAGIEPACVALRWRRAGGHRSDAGWLLSLLGPMQPAELRLFPRAFGALPRGVAPSAWPGVPAAVVQPWPEGVRVQVVRCGDEVEVWDESAQPCGAQVPEVLDWARQWPVDAVFEGLLQEQLTGEGTLSTGAALAKRLSARAPRRRTGATKPVRFIAADLLEAAGVNLMRHPPGDRQERLLAMLGEAGRADALPCLAVNSRADLEAQHRACRASGWLGLRLLGSSSWLWPLAPLQVKAVLVYVQHSGGAGSTSQYTFAVWSRTPSGEAAMQAVVAGIEAGDAPRPGALQLVPVARLETDIDEADAEQLNCVARDSVVQRFGPVRSLRPSLVAELAFDGVDRSRRHRSGLLLRTPRLCRLLPGASLQEVESAEDLARWAPAGDTNPLASRPGSGGDADPL